MSGLVLGTAALRDWLAEDQKLHDWAQAQSLPLYATTPSVAMLLANVEKLKPTQRKTWTDSLVREVPRRFGPRLRAFDLEAARQWSLLRAELDATPGNHKKMGTELMVVAIAVSEDLTYVERRQVVHEVLPQLKQIDPWTNSTYPT